MVNKLFLTGLLFYRSGELASDTSGRREILILETRKGIKHR